MDYALQILLIHAIYALRKRSVRAKLINDKICIGPYLHDARTRLESISWDADSKLAPMGYRPRMRINPFIMMDELSRSNAAVSRFGRDLCRDLASSVCHFGQEYMVAMRYHITHERGINDITWQRD